MKVTLRQIAEKACVTYRGIRMRAARESWPSCGTIVINHNETKLYAVKDLPANIQQLFNADSPASSLHPSFCPAPVATQERGFFAAAAGPKLSTGLALKRPELLTPAAVSSRPDSVTELKAWQRDVMTARLAILGAVESIASAENLTINRAIERFLELLANGMIDAAISSMAEQANHRKGSDRSLTKGTIYRWIRDRKEQGNLGLAPADKESMQVPPWAREFLALHRLPSKPTVPMVLEKMGDRAPSYAQANRFLKKFSRVDAQRGRMSGSELRSIRGYTRRDKSNLMPLDVVVADGHSFKATVAHPVHGRPFHPEMEGIIDAATRVCIGWSIGLAESSHVVADALRHAVTVNEKKPFGGVPAVFYSDNGAGNTAKIFSHEVYGILARINTSFKTGIPGNPQGRGLIERVQDSLWIRAAKELPTYTGKDMDTLQARKMYLLVNKDIKEKGTSDQLITWSAFLFFCQQQVDAYNSRPHSALPRVTDLSLGRKRNMTPAEMWQSFVADGWQPTLLSDDEIKDLFRPQVQVKVRRGQVTVFTNVYYHKALEHYHGEDVYVNYDIHCPAVVWVRDQEQRLIAEAVWDANKRSYFPVPVVEQARQKRMEGRIRRLEDKMHEVRQEGKGVIGGASGGDDVDLSKLAPPEKEEKHIYLFESDMDEAASL